MDCWKCFAARLPNGDVLKVGGFSGGYIGACEIYHPDSGQWTPTQGIQPSCSFAALLVGGKVLVTGGEVDESALASWKVRQPGSGPYDRGLFRQ